MATTKLSLLALTLAFTVTLNPAWATYIKGPTVYNPVPTTTTTTTVAPPSTAAPVISGQNSDDDADDAKSYLDGLLQKIGYGGSDDNADDATEQTTSVPEPVVS
jgi:hypothetical protein